MSHMLMTGDEYIHNVFKQAPVPVVVYKSAAFVIDLINEKGLEMWGRTYESVINRPLFEINPELKDQNIEEILTKVFTTGEPYTATELLLKYKRNNKPYSGYFNFAFYPVRDENGTIVGITSIGTDVSHLVNSRNAIKIQAVEFENAVKERTAELREANQKLEDRARQIRMLFNSAPDAVIIIDHLGRIINWNRMAETIFGWTSAEVEGKLLSSTIVPERYKSQHEAGMNKFLETGKGSVLNKPISIEAIKKDGSEIPVELKISVSTQGSSPLFIGFIRDLSQQRRDEYELKEVHERLEFLEEKLATVNNNGKGNDQTIS